MQQFEILDGMGKTACFTQAADIDEVKSVVGYLSDDAPAMAVCPVDHHPNGAHMVSLQTLRSFMEQHEAHLVAKEELLWS